MGRQRVFTGCLPSAGHSRPALRSTGTIETRLLCRLGLIGLLLLFAGPSRPLQAEAVPFAEGLLWRVERAEQPASYVFGTLHSSDERITDLPPAVADAFAGTSAVATEMIFDETVMLRLGQAMLLPDGRRLDAILPREQLSLMRGVAAHYRIPPAALMRFKPWAILAIFSFPPAEYQRTAAGLKPLDQKLQADATAAGKAVYGLETADEQIAALDGMPEPDQVALLGVTLEQATDIERNFALLRNAYLDRNLLAVRDTLNASLTDESLAAVRRFEERLIVERNRRMVERMDSLLVAGNAFIAVGALHLPGEAGILSLLAGSGYQITRVY